MRTLVTPPVLPPAALAELKQWLGITITEDDAGLTALLRTACELCEDFTGRVPLACTAEEVLNATGDWQELASRPVQAITSVESLPTGAPRFALPSTAYELELDAQGGGHVRIVSTGLANRIAVRFDAGIAADWASLPDTLRHGIVRLAAHQHRLRDDDRAAPLPPAAVAALWRPWRRMRLT